MATPPTPKMICQRRKRQSGERGWRLIWPRERVRERVAVGPSIRSLPNSFLPPPFYMNALFNLLEINQPT